MLDADTKIRFRKDFGVHGLSEKQGYPKRIKIDHYNIELQTRACPGTKLNDWNKIANFHIVVDNLGNVTDFF